MAPLASKFGGTATLTTTNRRAPGPFVQKVTLTAVIDAKSATVADIAMTPIHTPPFPVKHPLLGQMDIVTTVTLLHAALGEYDAVSGRIAVDLDLHVAHRNAATGKATWVQVLRRRASGSALTPGSDPCRRACWRLTAAFSTAIRAERISLEAVFFAAAPQWLRTDGGGDWTVRSRAMKTSEDPAPGRAGKASAWHSPDGPMSAHRQATSQPPGWSEG